MEDVQITETETRTTIDELTLDSHRMNTLSHLVFGRQYRFGDTVPIEIDRAFLEDDGCPSHGGCTQGARYLTVSCLLNAIDDDEQLQDIFELKDLRYDLAFALRHALIAFLRRLDQEGASAVNLMVDTLTHFMKEHPSLSDHFDLRGSLSPRSSGTEQCPQTGAAG